MNSTHRPRPDVERWLLAFAGAVRARDYAGARDLFDPAVVGFGTVSARTSGIEALHRDQWLPVWDETEGFAFDLDDAVCWEGADQVVVGSGWSSTGFDDEGRPRTRRGRATVVLVVDGERPTAVHTHFSMLPGTPA